MTPEEFIKNNPFPKNGKKINEDLVKDIQDPTKSHFVRRNLYKLLKNNARLIYVIHRQYNYSQTLGSIMSFVYEGLKKATETYDPDVGMPFYHYAVQTIRGLLQNFYNYNESLIHVPVMKRKITKVEYSDINDFSEHQYMDIHDNDSLSSEMDMIIKEYEAQPLSEQSIEDLKILKMYRQHTLKDISHKTNINTVKLRKMIDRATFKLKKFHVNLKRKLNGRP